MNGISKEAARARAESALADMGIGVEVSILDNSVLETETAWYFPYNSTEYIAHGTVSAALAGNLPVKVPKDGTAIGYDLPPGRR
ncbi:YrhB domain-containing protein [Segniliparus rugosus]|nr:YrhB domain-containing protein [Segniliparus rugosus]